MSAKKLAESGDVVTDLQGQMQLTPQGRVQRLVFVASLYFKLLGIKNPTPAELNAVNSKFHLVHRPSALRFPAAISNLIWGKVNLTDAFKRYKANEEAISKLVIEVLSQAPNWVKYGDGRTIKQDIQAVFDCVPAR